MENFIDKIYDYEEISNMVAQDIMIEESCKLIGITGTSCVGKSTFTNLIKRKLENDFSVQIIGVDSYLKEAYRGDKKFWIGTDTSDFLTPVHFDWEKLKQDIELLRQGKRIQKQHYNRGIGWKNVKVFEPADIIIVEGLFLDSVQAAVHMEYDKVIALCAEDDLIRKLRMDRDDYYRKNFENFKRTKNETVRETESTLRAGKVYQKCLDKWNRLELFVQEGFKARLKEYILVREVTV